MLREAGRVGYRALTLESVLERAAVGRTQFRRLFADMEECFARAYAAEAERLGDRLLAACDARETWQDALAAALGELDAFIVADPELAVGLLGQARLAREPVPAKRAAVKARLMAAIDAARLAAGPEHDPPPLAAEFVLAAIEEAAVDVLARRAPAEFAAAIPDLTFVAVATYFGGTAARRAFGQD